jgi:hypothetical protein
MVFEVFWNHTARNTQCVFSLQGITLCWKLKSYRLPSSSSCFSPDRWSRSDLITDCVNAVTYVTASKIWELLLIYKLNFHHHVAYISSVVGLIRTETCSSLQGFLMLHCTLVRHKLEQAAIVWNFISSPVASNLQCIQHFLSLCHLVTVSQNTVMLMPKIIWNVILWSVLQHRTDPLFFSLRNVYF